MVDRFTVYQSNMLHTPTAGTDATYTHVLAGHPKAISFASQFTNTETVRLETPLVMRFAVSKCMARGRYSRLPLRR